LEAFSSILDGGTSSEEEARSRLRRENGRAEAHTTLQAIWDEEALSVLLRILVDGSGFQTIRESLFGENRTVDDLEQTFAPLIRFLAREQPFDFVGRASAIAETLGGFAKLTPGFAVHYDGPHLRLPYVLRGREGEPRVPLALTSLAFLISEMLTNTAKHQWPSLKSKLRSDGIRLLLRVANVATDTFDLSICSKPTLRASPSPDLEGEDRTVTGLTSLRMVAAGLGTTIDCKPVMVNGTLKGEYPFPENRELVWNGILSMWSTYSLRGLELAQPDASV
jgi:hypothetical protein